MPVRGRHHNRGLPNKSTERVYVLPKREENHQPIVPECIDLSRDMITYPTTTTLGPGINSVLFEGDAQLFTESKNQRVEVGGFPIRLSLDKVIRTEEECSVTLCSRAEHKALRNIQRKI